MSACAPSPNNNPQAAEWPWQDAMRRQRKLDSQPLGDRQNLAILAGSLALFDVNHKRRPVPQRQVLWVRPIASGFPG